MPLCLIGTPMPPDKSGQPRVVVRSLAGTAAWRWDDIPAQLSPARPGHKSNQQFLGVGGLIGVLRNLAEWHGAELSECVPVSEKP